MKHYLGLSLLLVTIAVIAVASLYSCAKLADRTVDHVRSAFAQVLSFQPQVTINQRIILTQTEPVAELAVVSKEALITAGFTQHLEVLSYEVPLTEKSLKLEATYRFKAGFDLHQPFRVEINPLTHAIQAHLSPAKILSVERVGEMTFQGEDSALNRLTDAERQKALNDLDIVARDTAEKSGLKEDAERQIQERLTQILAHNGEKFEASWDKSSAALIEKP